MSTKRKLIIKVKKKAVLKVAKQCKSLVKFIKKGVQLVSITRASKYYESSCLRWKLSQHRHEAYFTKNYRPASASSVTKNSHTWDMIAASALFWLV